MTRRPVVLCVVLAFALAACSTGPGRTHSALPEPGQCIAKEVKDLDNVAPDYASVVNCRKPHVYEIVDVLTVPKRFLVKGSPSKVLQRRTELAKSAATGSVARTFQTYADRACRRSVLKGTGLDVVNVNGLSALDAGVRPVLIGAATSTGVDSADQWASGSPRIVCSIRYTDPVSPGTPQGKLSAIRSPSSIPMYRTLLTKNFPAERRACGSYDSDNYMYAVLCTNQHNSELLFSYDAEAAFGIDLVKNVNGLNPTDDEWDELEKPCDVMLRNVVGNEVDEDLDGFAYLNDNWNNRASRTRNFTIYCLITPDDDHLDLPPGSVVGRAGQVTEVPAKKGKRLTAQSAT